MMPIGIAELDTGDHVVRFCHRDVGLINHRRRFRCFAPPRDMPDLLQSQKLSTIIPVQSVDHQSG
jgi:hypothetical protein